MTEYEKANQFIIPATHEVPAVTSATQELDAAGQALREALDFAPDVHTLDPTNIDRARSENFGAAATSEFIATPLAREVYFDPTNPKDLIAVGQGVIAMRDAEMAA